MKKNKVVIISDIVKRHPEYVFSPTDRAYADLANNLFAEMQSVLTFMDDKEIKNAAISITLYIEDKLSGTQQFNAFAKLYQKMYGYRLPFYENNDEAYEFDSLKFVVWHSICAERRGSIINPIVGVVDEVAKNIYGMLPHIKEDFHLEPNIELADYIFSVETLADAIQVKNVLIWLNTRSFFGHWIDNDPREDHYGMKHTFPNVDTAKIVYGNESFMAFDHLTWPLSMKTQHIYAEMVRLDMDDEDDEFATEIGKIEFKEYGFYHIEGYEHDDAILKDYLGNKFTVASDSSDTNLRKRTKNCNIAVGAYFKYCNSWNVCGINSWLDLPDGKFEEMAAELKVKYDLMHNHCGQYDNYINAHGGRRMYFFENTEEYKKWLSNDLHYSTIPDGIYDINDAEGLIAYFEDNGQLSLSVMANLVKHPDNPCYDPDKAIDTAFSLLTYSQFISSGMLEYIMKNNLIPDAQINDRRGSDYGYVICQENMDFIARCFRRDFNKTEVFCPRRVVPLPGSEREPWEDENTPTIHDFVNLVKANKYVVSAANKHWLVQKVTRKEIVLYDENKGVSVTLDTEELYEASKDLKSWEIQVSNVAKYVGRKLASPATAVLYTVYGRGSTFAVLRRFFQ